MRGTSAESLREVVSAAETRLASQDAPLEQTAEDLFSVARVIDSSNRLIRVLSDGGRAPQLKQDAARSLLGDKVPDVVLEIVLDVVGRRWSQQEDILDALERVGVGALLMRAEREDRLGLVEEQLFQLSRLIEQSPQLSTALDDARDRPSERADLMGRLLDGRADPITVLLARQAVGRRSDTKPAQRVLELARIASERRQRLLAIVSTAHPLSEAQLERLTRILTRTYGREVQLNVETDPAVVGGLRIQVGDDLYDATVLARLAQARERLAA